MVDTYIYIVEDLLFFLTGFLLLYFFILAIASHFKRISYPKTPNQYRCAILVSETSTLPLLYKEDSYEFIVYQDLIQTIQSLNEEEYNFVIILSDSACALSPKFLKKIFDLYDAGIKVIQLHSILENRKSLRSRFCAIYDEINNSLFRVGSTQLGFSSALFGTNMAIDLKWLKNNQKTIKTNLERKLLRQHIYIEYLPDTIVYCKSLPIYPYRKRFRMTLSYLFPSLLEGNWSFCNRIIQQLTPSPAKLYISICIWTLLITAYDWTLSIKWWSILFGFTITCSLAIPDYLVEDKKKKKYFIWRKAH